VDTVTILRQLWRFRLLVAVVAVVAILVGLLVSYKLPSMESRKYEVGVATARILVDTPASQVVDVAPKGSDSLGPRANLLSSLMVDGEIKTEIAKRSGLRPEQLIGISQSVAAPSVAAPRIARDSFVLSTEVTTIPNGGWLPIIEIETQAPTKEAAGRLANAAVDGLREFLDSKAAAEAVPNAERLRVNGLGIAQAQLVTRGPRLLFSLIAMVFVFGAGCATILVLSGLIRALRSGETAPVPVAHFVEHPFDSRHAARANGTLVVDGEAEQWPPPDKPVYVIPSVTGERAKERPAAKPQQKPRPAPDKPGAWWGGDPS
jgi:hypothetical protein